MATVEQVALVPENRIVLSGISWNSAWIRNFRAWVRERFAVN
ncbi:MAG TPA: hypothetical protein VFI31_02690 [Pirellulales bacterium]|nr:hypothetical protein [Pirellulales bacterium]